jgi:trehalose 6-phosphate synthase
MSRLVVVSNRVAPVDEGKQAAGGLAVAIAEALRAHGGIWFGWSGEVGEQTSKTPKVAARGKLTYATLDLDQRDLDEYYNGFANSTLWPLFHYRLGLASFSRRTYEGYQRVNEHFADALVGMLEPDDRVWVHDYHLIPLGEALRRRGAKQRMGFFLHTPFPSQELLVALPNHREIVASLCAYDIVGFQSDRDLRAFASYITYEAGGTVVPAQDGSVWVEAFGFSGTARVFPISIDTATLAKLAEDNARSRTTERLVKSLVGRRLIIGVDRLDYSKGLLQRFEAFQALLEASPKYHGQVSFMQIAPPSRTDVPEYQQIRRELETAAGHINGRFATFDWVPIRYLNSSFGRKTLAGFYRSAQVGLVTPLRDGMNLVAKEYAACQDPEDPGVLVLSRFAGAARELDGGALVVNPYDVEGVADALDRALAMPLEERRERHAAMFAILSRHDITAWRESFVAALTAARDD